MTSTGAAPALPAAALRAFRRCYGLGERVVVYPMPDASPPQVVARLDEEIARKVTQASVATAGTRRSARRPPPPAPVGSAVRIRPGEWTVAFPPTDQASFTIIERGLTEPGAALTVSQRLSPRAATIVGVALVATLILAAASVAVAVAESRIAALSGTLANLYVWMWVSNRRGETTRLLRRLSGDLARPL